MTTPPPITVRTRGDEMEIEIGPTTAATGVAAVRQVLEHPDSVGLAVHLVADHPAGTLDPVPEQIADATGHTQRRDLLKMGRGLPLAADEQPSGFTPLTTRPFVVGSADEQRWIEVNNRAFVDHPDQGRETPATLAERMAEPWFDAEGFLVADDAGRPDAFAGFCWTKEHPATEDEPAQGEIYVIGVDPSHQREGLGLRLVLAGLEHLARRGLTKALLYVEADNAAAVALYERLGFETVRRRRVYTP